MDKQDFLILISFIISTIIILTIIYHLGAFISFLTGWPHILTMILVFVGIFVGSFLFGFFLIPGGQPIWEKKEKEVD